MKLKLINNTNEIPIEKGDGFAYLNGELGYYQLAFVCPGCGRLTAPLGKLNTNGKHRFDRETLSVTPSVVHDKEYGGCGWHGFLTNGEFSI